jgi:heme O synthase-like polyprenyltransferase
MPGPPAPYPNYQHGGYQQAGNIPVTPKSSGLSTASMTMGITVLSVFVLALIPCLGWVNWINIPLAVIANILSWVVIITEGKNLSSRNKALIGLIFSFLAIFIGSIRLAIGGGCV